MGENLQRYIAEARQRAKEIRKPLVQEVRALVTAQRKERQTLIDKQQARWGEETRTRAARLPRGVKGIWHKATGAYAKTRLQNERETKAAIKRDRKELHSLVRSHLLERQDLEHTIKSYKEEHKAEALRIRQEIAQYISTGTEPPPAQTKPVEDKPVSVQMAETETKIALLSGDLTLLQSSLENNLISDEMRGALRRMIERTLETLHIKDAEERAYQEKRQKKELKEKQEQLNKYIRHYAELQVKQDQETKRQSANRQFHSIIMNMSYALNGIPRWPVYVMAPPPEKRLNEQKYTAALRQQSNTTLLETLFNPVKPVIDPPMATVHLRTSILQTKEVLCRAGVRPDDNKRDLTKTPKQNRQQRPAPQETSRFI